VAECSSATAGMRWNRLCIKKRTDGKIRTARYDSYLRLRKEIEILKILTVLMKEMLHENKINHKSFVCILGTALILSSCNSANLSGATPRF
jgi:hypothetical protein